MPRPFADQVQDLHQTWAERREVSRLTSAHDFQSQLELLQALHGWTVADAADVREVYGEGFRFVVSDRPSAERPVFMAVVEDQHCLVFSLASKQLRTKDHWRIEVRLAVNNAAVPVPAAPARRPGPWSRARLEQLLLTLLGTYERSLTPGAAPAPPPLPP